MSSVATGYHPISTSINYGEIGQSSEARDLFYKVNDIIGSIKPYNQKWVFDELALLSMEAAEDNWDGQGSKRLDHDTYQAAKRFVQALPLEIPPPEVIVDADGEVNFEWYGKQGQRLTMALRKDGRVAYAGQFSIRSRASGMEEFNDSVPKELVECIKKVYPR
jgi:hypothetical protein